MIIIIFVKRAPLAINLTDDLIISTKDHKTLNNHTIGGLKLLDKRTLKVNKKVRIINNVFSLVENCWQK